jgi:formate-dependent phosphoribosylglycinamide formyltransferase (GAR transformylase)
MVLINYKEGKYTVRVVGHVADDMYWVRQWQPKKLGFKGKQWQKKANYIKEKK